MLNIRDMDVSKNIRTIRESKNLTQLDVANALGTERSNYARLESRGENLTLKQLNEISTALGVTLLDLLGEEVTSDKNSIQPNEELERIKEKLEITEEILRDKKKNIKLYKSFIEWTRDKIRFNFNLSAISAAEDLELIEIDPDKDVNIYEYNLSEEQLYKVGVRMLDPYECAAYFLNEFIAASGFIADEWYIKAYKTVSRKRKEKVSPAESINWVNGVFEFLEEE